MKNKQRRIWLWLLPFLMLGFLFGAYRTFPEQPAPVPGRLWEDPGTLILNEGQEEPFTDTLQALSACIMDAENFRVLYSKAGTEIRKMASTTKIMTCILALENCDLSETVTVSAYAASMPDVQLSIREGEEYVLEDLLYSMMLESHNDSAVAIAEHVAGSEEAFCEMMTRKARDLGAEHTSFATANGLDAENHYTTAEDLARIAAYAVQNETFLRIVGTESRTIQEIHGKRSFFLKNIDRYLYMDGEALGIKTGFTGGAGYCFVGATRYEGRILVSVVLGSGWPPHKQYKWKDTKALVAYVRKYYQPKQLSVKPQVLGELRVADGLWETVPVGIAEGWSEELLMRQEEVELIFHLPEMLCAPLEKGTSVGYAEIRIGGVTGCCIPVVALQTVPSYEFSDAFSRICAKFFY